MTADNHDLALQRLVLTLQIAAQLPDRDDGGRTAAKLQLNAVIKFLDNLVSTTRLEINPHDPLFRLLAALEDLESGPTPLMFESRAKKGHPQPTIDGDLAKTFAAAAMDRLMWPRPGRSRQGAAEYVARKIRNWSVTKIGVERQFSWKTVAYWRDSFNSGSERLHRDTMLYMALKRKAAELPRTKAVEALLHSQPLRKF